MGCLDTFRLIRGSTVLPVHRVPTGLADFPCPFHCREKNLLRRSKSYRRERRICQAQAGSVQDDIRAFTEQIPLEGWQLNIIVTTGAILAAYTALQILLWDYRNRRTDDPSEQDRSESYSIKQQKTYDWKQENIRGGKLPPKPQKPPAKKASQDLSKLRELPKMPRIPRMADFPERFRDSAADAADGSFAQFKWQVRTEALSQVFADVTIKSIRELREWPGLGNALLLDLICTAEGFDTWRPLLAAAADLSSVKLKQGLGQQVVEELAASIAVDIMVGILDVKTSVDTTFGIYGAQVEQQATGSES